MMRLTKRDAIIVDFAMIAIASAGQQLVRVSIGRQGSHEIDVSWEYGPNRGHVKGPSGKYHAMGGLGHDSDLCFALDDMGLLNEPIWMRVEDCEKKRIRPRSFRLPHQCSSDK